jgi:TrmH family RNA methyltransferase
LGEPIKSNSNRLIKEVRKISKDRSERNRLGRFLIEGYKFALEAINEHNACETVIVSESYTGLESALILDAAHVAGCEVVWVTESIMGLISESKTPQGVICICRIPEEFTPIPDARSAIFALSAIQDPGNIGAIIRVVAALGHPGIVISSDCADPFSPKAARASAGHCLGVPIRISYDLAGVIDEFRSYGAKVFAAGGGGTLTLSDCEDLSRTLVLFGSEGSGISQDLLAMTDGVISIPMAKGVESLNVAVAAGVIGYMHSGGRPGFGRSELVES